jgi:nucleotide-binding universal stress UspA family protein
MTIVVGFIPTPEGHAALHRAADEARLRRTRLVVVNSRDEAQRDDQAAVASFEAALEQARRSLAEDGLDHEVRAMARGRLPSEDLLEVAEEVDAAMIVIGLRRRSPVGKLFLGSQSQQILLEAERPVLAVKAGG